MELAKRGEIDPWDIDIAMATEKFLQYIDSLEKRDLRIPARTLLYASILLRMKSDSMEGQKEEEPEPEMEEIAEEQEEEIEENLPRPPVRRLTKRPVTLDELISELKKAEMVGRRKAMRERWPSIEEVALDVSHDEGIEDRIKALGPILDDMFMETKTVTFQDINSKNSKTEDGVTNYVSLLFMAQRKQVWLEQEEIFGDLFVSRPGKPPIQLQFPFRSRNPKISGRGRMPPMGLMPEETGRSSSSESRLRFWWSWPREERSIPGILTLPRLQRSSCSTSTPWRRGI